MKEIFELYAKYNLETDRTMFEILTQLSPEKLSLDMGNYYTSIIGTLNHIVISTINWIRRLSSFFPELEKIPVKLPNVQVKTPMEVNWKDIKELERIFTTLDALLKETIDLIPDKKLTNRFKYKNWKGDEQNKVAWQMLLHIFNHQTHHRGTIAALLDQQKVENDYSNLININL